jgi:hypothetical protein
MQNCGDFDPQGVRAKSGSVTARALFELAVGRGYPEEKRK